MQQVGGQVVLRELEEPEEEVVDRRNHNTGKLTIDLSHKKNWLAGKGNSNSNRNRNSDVWARNQKYEQGKETTDQTAGF